MRSLQVPTRPRKRWIVAHISKGVSERDVRLLQRNGVHVVVENNYVKAVMYDKTQHGDEAYVLVRHGMGEFRAKFDSLQTSSQGTIVYEIVVTGKTIATIAARVGRRYDATDRLGARWVRYWAQRQVLAVLRSINDPKQKEQ